MTGSPALRFAHLAIALGILLVTALAWTLHDTREKTKLAVQSVMHSHAVLQAIDQASERHAVAEVAQRAYLLSGAASMLQEREGSLRRTAASIDRLIALTADNPAQQASARLLAERVAERQKIMEDAAELRKQGGLQAALDFIDSGIPEAAAQRVREVSERLTREELRLLALRQADEQRRESIAENSLLATFAAAVALLVPSYVAFQRQVRRSRTLEHRLQELAQQLPVALYQLRRLRSGGWQTEYLSERIAQVHAVEVEAARSDPEKILETVCAEDKPQLNRRLQEARPGGPPFEVEYRVDAGGVPCSRWVRSSANVSAGSDGSVVFNGYWDDITEQKRLIAELEAAHREANAASRAKSAFLATMSHEIRTPMNGVLGMLELLDLTRLDSEQRATLAVVRESGHSLLRIIDDILDFSKIEAGRLDLHPEAASIARIVERACQLHSGAASSKGLMLSCRTDPKIGPAHRVDPLRLGQILNNLLNNAIKFTHSGAIDVRADLLDRSNGKEMLRLSIQDSGIGMSDEQQALLFRPFVQAATDIAGKYGGTGLGLAICRRLADLMGGRIDMVSTPAHGTTMSLTVELPLADPAELSEGSSGERHAELAAALASRRVAPHAERAAEERTLVLVVDDHPVNRVVLLRQVQTLGYAAEAVENGAKGIERWRSGRFGLVITDINMPVINGYEMTRQLRQIEAQTGASRTPVIACTANALRGEADVCFEAGMDDFLVKPVSLNDLMARLDRWLPLPDSSPMPLDAIDSADEGAAGRAPLDLATLAEISLGDPQVEREILLDFRRINDEDAVLLRQAVATGDSPQVTRLAHRIKGSSRMVGAEKLAAVCNQIERASRAGESDQLPERMERFQFELQRLNAYLDAIHLRDTADRTSAADANPS